MTCLNFHIKGVLWIEWFPFETLPCRPALCSAPSWQESGCATFYRNSFSQTVLCIFEACQPVDNCTLSSSAVIVRTNQPLETAVLLYSDFSQPWLVLLYWQGRSSVSERVHASKQSLCVSLCSRVITVASGAATSVPSCCFKPLLFYHIYWIVVPGTTGDKSTQKEVYRQGNVSKVEQGCFRSVKLSQDMPDWQLSACGW